MNLGHRLAMLTAEKLKLKTRSEKPGLLGRASLAYPSPVDWEEARLCGQAAVEAAEDGKSGVMVTLVREQGTAGHGPLLGQHLLRPAGERGLRRKEAPCRVEHPAAAMSRRLRRLRRAACGQHPTPRAACAFAGRRGERAQALR